MACSALKRSYRDLLREHAPEMITIYAKGGIELIRGRISGRHHEYMPTSLLQSQFDTLEERDADEAGITVDIGRVAGSDRGAHRRIPHAEAGRQVKISRIETFLVPPRWLFVRVETDSGVVGWGEPVLEGRSETVRTAVEQLSELLIGEDPLRIEDHWQVMTKGSFYRGGPILSSAVSGLDQALWDIAGKTLGRAGAPAARRTRARSHPDVRLGGRRRAVRGRRRHLRTTRGGPDRGQDERERADGRDRERRPDRWRRTAGRRRPGGAGAAARRRGGLPRTVHPGRRQAGRAAPRTAASVLSGGAGRAGELAPHRQTRAVHVDSGGDR